MKNKKKLFVIILIILALFVGFYYIKSRKDITSDSSLDSSQDKGIFTSVKDALSKNLTLICEFKDDQGSTTKSYIKNGAMRITLTDDSQEMGEVVIKDNRMYNWDRNTKKGYIYDIPESESGSDTDNKIGSYYEMIDEYKDFCKVSAVSDSYFDIPTDVSFQDMSKFLEDYQNQMPQIPQ